jgi:hypothetical protein
MKSVKRGKEWWVTGLAMDCEDCGPYPDKERAEETRQGLQRTFDNWDNWSFWTTDPQPKEKKCAKTP